MIMMSHVLLKSPPKWLCAVLVVFVCFQTLIHFWMNSHALCFLSIYWLIFFATSSTSSSENGPRLRRSSAADGTQRFCYLHISPCSLTTNTSFPGSHSALQMQRLPKCFWTLSHVVMMWVAVGWYCGAHLGKCTCTWKMLCTLRHYKYSQESNFMATNRRNVAPSLKFPTYIWIKVNQPQYCETSVAAVQCA